MHSSSAGMPNGFRTSVDFGAPAPPPRAGGGLARAPPPPPAAVVVVVVCVKLRDPQEPAQSGMGMWGQVPTQQIRICEFDVCEVLSER